MKKQMQVTGKYLNQSFCKRVEGLIFCVFLLVGEAAVRRKHAKAKSINTRREGRNPY